MSLCLLIWRIQLLQWLPRSLLPLFLSFSFLFLLSLSFFALPPSPLWGPFSSHYPSKKISKSANCVLRRREVFETPPLFNTPICEWRVVGICERSLLPKVATWNLTLDQFQILLPKSSVVSRVPFMSPAGHHLNKLFNIISNVQAMQLYLRDFIVWGALFVDRGRYSVLVGGRTVHHHHAKVSAP